MTGHFVEVTEIEGQQVSAEQLDRICHRYHWAARLGADLDVIEVACGAGQGLGILADRARTLRAGDLSESVLESARRTFGDLLDLRIVDAESLPFESGSADVIVFFEAIYYLSNPERFAEEACRVLRPGGRVLIATANKDLYDFTPSPYSKTYFGVVELAGLFRQHGFDTEFWGHTRVDQVSVRQRILRPVKFVATKLNLIPKTMHSKALLKRLFFGEMTLMPGDLRRVPYRMESPDPLPATEPARKHKVIYCAATLKENYR